MDLGVVVWFFRWHTGIGSGMLGNVSYSNGLSTPLGSLDQLIAPVPLIKGRGYYWAIWEWDEDGVYINSSSDLGYFIIQN